MPIYTRDALVVIALGPDYPGAMRTVAVVIHWIRDVVRPVIAVEIVKCA